MTVQELHQLLVSEFGEARITGANLAARDPWIEVAPDAIHAVARFLKHDPRTQFDHLNDLTAVDWFDADPKKAAKIEDPHLEVVYHLTSYPLHLADHGTDAIEKEKELLLLSTEGRRLYEIDAALRRLYRDPERFGVCERCGRKIDFERLAIVPWARHCVECKTLEENGF